MTNPDPGARGVVVGTIGASADRPMPGAGVRRLHDLLPVLIRAPSVRLRFTVPDAGRRLAADALGLDVLKARVQEISFLDTPTLYLSSRGVLLRARRRTGGGVDSSVSCSHLGPGGVPAGIRADPGFRTDVTVLPEGFVCSVSVRAPVDGSRVRAARQGHASARKLFSESQLAFYDTICPGGPPMKELALLGSVHVLRQKVRLPELDRRLVAEHWFLPDGGRMLELSTRCTPVDAFTVAVAVKECLAGRGLELVADQQRRRAVAHLSGALDPPRPSILAYGSGT